jgi:hypothetical protein
MNFTGDLATLMTLGFYVLAIFYVIFSVILYYHWMQYAVDKKVRNLSLLIYFLATIPLLGVMALMIFAA